MNSFHKGISERKREHILESRSQLDETLDNIWKDASALTNRRNMITLGLSISLGIAGFFLSPETGIMGLLGSLGFTVADRALDIEKLQISRRISRLISKDYLYNIYDFQQRRRLSP